MINIENQYEYEVAFSFLQQDEGLAYEIADLIQDKFSTFIYSQKQIELVGKDGEKTFNEVFSKKSRFVVILYRELWGATSWTRIEETAIRNRAHEEGYDFSTFVQLDSNSKMPLWLPKNRIYFNFDRWGAKGLASVIEARIHEAGGQSNLDSLEEQVARLKRKVILEKERTNFLVSDEGYVAAQIEFNNLYQLLERTTKDLEDSEIQLRFGYSKNPNKEFIVRYESYSLCFNWKYKYSNNLRDSGLIVWLSIYQNHKERTLIISEYDFDFNPSSKERGWCLKKELGSFITSELLMKQWLKLFLDKVHDVKVMQSKR